VHPGTWDNVEKDAGCGEISNRLTLSYGSNGTQTVNDTVLNWRNFAPAATERSGPQLVEAGAGRVSK